MILINTINVLTCDISRLRPEIIDSSPIVKIRLLILYSALDRVTGAKRLPPARIIQIARHQVLMLEYLIFLLIHHYCLVVNRAELILKVCMVAKLLRETLPLGLVMALGDNLIRFDNRRMG